MVFEPAACADGGRRGDTVLDAGGESGANLSGALYRCMDELCPGQVLLVISKLHGSRTRMREWCRIAGHRIIATETSAADTLFWIRKS